MRQSVCTGLHTILHTNRSSDSWLQLAEPRTPENPQRTLWRGVLILPTVSMVPTCRACEKRVLGILFDEEEVDEQS